MSIRTKNTVIGLSVTLVLLAGFAVNSATGEQYKVVIPPYLKTVEGDESGCQSISGCVGIPFRAQVVYPAAEFASLPQADLVITGTYWRPDHTTTPRSGEIAHLLYGFSTTDKGPGELSTVYANNLGDDVVTVFEGPVSLATQALGPDGGPKEFDYYFPMQTPFLYDPTAGRNLLVDFKTESGFSFVALHDNFTSSLSREVFSYNAPDALSGGYYYSVPVVQFVFETVSPADFNLDLTVNHEDLAIWQGGYGSPGLRENGDANGDGLVTGTDFLVWQREYVASVPGLAAEFGIPEPATVSLLLLGVVAGVLQRKR